MSPTLCFVAATLASAAMHFGGAPVPWHVAAGLVAYSVAMVWP